jgi:methylmalonyl-CoA mutase N-terminal domain/subunit
MLAYINATNSCHSNSADEPFTTPSTEYVQLAAHAQAILLEETGLFRFMMNTLAGSPGMQIVERAVEQGIVSELAEIDRLGGVLAAIEQRYQRSQIQASAHRYEQQIYTDIRPIIGLNRYQGNTEPVTDVRLVRTPAARKQLQIERLQAFKRRHQEQAQHALDKLAQVVEGNGNVFAELLHTVEVCSLGQITERLAAIVGRYRPSV